MGKTPFKMKGSPMQRNFGIGSPAKAAETREEAQARIDAAAERKEAVKEKRVDVTSEYSTSGTSETREHINAGGKVYRNPDGSITLA